MFVENWMTPNPITLPPQTTISAAALEMSRHKFRHLLIAEPTPTGKKLIGLLSKYDVARAFPNNTNPFSIEVSDQTVPMPVSTIMVRNPITVEPYCAIEDAARILRTRRINALPVVRSGKLVGIITESDIFDALLGMTGANANGVKLLVESDNVQHSLVAISQLSDQHRLIIQSAISFHDNKLHNKVVSGFHFTTQPSPRFLQDLAKLGIRVLKVG
jgi:acetoin utilization protein AcuB